MDKYDNSSDSKRHAGQDNADSAGDQGDDYEFKMNEKAREYLRELFSEKIKLKNAKISIAAGLIDQDVTKVQAIDRTQQKDNTYLDVYNEKSTKVTVKVLVPVKEHPKFNFVGKLLGPKGNTLKQLQEETMCKMAVLGRGSMRDRNKEEGLRNTLDPKYAHLTDELHVEISAIASPSEAYARIAFALAEVKKYLLPDLPNSGGLRMCSAPMEQGHPVSPPGRPPASAPPRTPPVPIPRSIPCHVPPQGAPGMPQGAPGMPQGAPGIPQGAPGMPQGHGQGRKTKVINMFQQRSAMESSYSGDDGCSSHPPTPPVSNETRV